MDTAFSKFALAAAPLVAATGVSAEGEKYILVSPAPDGDSWWNTIKNGNALAGEQMNVEVEYRNPATGELADMARIIDQAAASGPNGIITTLAKRRTVAIARAVHFGANIPVLDEPTSALGVRQTSNVLAAIGRVRKQGVGVVFISHSLRHALPVGDRFTVLSRGQTLGTAKRGDVSPEELQDLMAGGQELAQLEGLLGGTV